MTIVCYTVCMTCGGLRPTNIWLDRKNLRPLGPGLFFGSQSKQSKHSLTEEIRLLSEVTTYMYFIMEIDEKTQS